MTYTEGDRVRIKNIDWYNENKDKNGNIELSTHIFIPEMSQFCGKVVTIKDVFEDIDYNVIYNMEEIDCDWTDEMIEGLVEEENVLNKWTGLKVELELSKSVIGVSNLESLRGERFMSGFVKAIIPPEGYIFKDENDNVINTTKIVLEKKKKEYPKTYEECCDILQLEHTFEINDLTIEEETLLKPFIQLKRCRDAYWKIAGEEMGLGKAWEPDWNTSGPKYVIAYTSRGIEKQWETTYCKCFAFPTEKIRDAFYENFKSEIESCKEFL